MSSQIYMKYNWQCASVELAICTARVEGNRAGPRALLHALRVAGENNIGGFNPDRQTVKFNSPSNFPAIRHYLYEEYEGGYTLLEGLPEAQSRVSNLAEYIVFT